MPSIPKKAAPAELKQKWLAQERARLQERVDALLAEVDEAAVGEAAAPAQQGEGVFAPPSPVGAGQEPPQGGYLVPGQIPSPVDADEVVAAEPPQVLIWRQHFEYQGTFDERYAHMVSKLLEGALRLDHDSVTEIWAEDGRLIGHRWNLLNARIAQPRVDPGEIAGVDHTGPWRLHLLHGVPLERLGGVSRTTCLLGFSPEVGGAGENMVYFRGFAGMLNRARLAKKAIDVARSSKAPEGVLLEATGYVNVASVKYGGHEREAAIVRRGLATHAPRAQQWVLHPDDAQLTGIYLVR
jgi:hypothetical protein